MCGIAGIIAVEQSAPQTAPGLVRAMCDQIVHRGPDDFGEFRCPVAHIGMRRLAIIDLHSGQQPMASDDGRVQMVLNGEIYNYKLLRAELVKAGQVFHTESDAEVALRAYLEWGDDAIARLRGMFALAIVDLNRGRCLLARDRIGKKPLYYTVLPSGNLAFGSELKTLHAVPGFNPGLAEDALRDYFSLGYVPGTKSIYCGVHKLAPSTMMVIKNGQMDLYKYAEINFGPKWTGSDAELKERLHAELDDAVKVRLASDVPFGAFLSGGLDSSVVCALMSRHLSEPVKTFTIGFGEQDFNEMPEARQIASHIGAQHHELVVKPDAVRLVEDLGRYFDEPFGDSSALPTYLVSQLASKHVKMVLSGDGGDELFAGYSRYRDFHRLQTMRRATLGAAPGLLSALAPVVGAQRGNRFRRIAQRLRQGYPDNYLSGVALARADDLALLFGPAAGNADPYTAIRSHFGRTDIDLTMERVLYGDMRSYLVDDILVKVDRASMANSLEARAPLLDQQLIDFCARLPYEQKYRGGVGKYLFRSIARDLLPHEVLNKPKQGFAIPIDHWFRTDLKPMLQDVLGSRAFRERGLFSVQGVDRLIAEHFAGTHQWGEMLWLLLTFETWAQRYGYHDSNNAVEAVAL